MGFWDDDSNEVDATPYANSGTWLITETGEVIQPFYGHWSEIKTPTCRMSLMKGGGVGVVWDPDAPEGDPRRPTLDPR